MIQCDDHFRELMDRVRNGSEDAARELVDQYGDDIRRAVRRALNDRLRSKFDSLDFVQIVWNSLFRVRDELGRFNCPEQLVGYLVAMAQNKVGLEGRRRLMTKKHGVKRERPLEVLESEDEIDSSGGQPDPIDVAIAHEQWDHLLEGQPQSHRQIIQLRLHGHTCQEIADAMHVDERTVRRVLKRLLSTTVA
jgi:RNA polymerase sigma factor (sigma-70 family)